MKKTLKTLAVTVIAALTMSLTGCQKDADLIVGTWDVTSETISWSISGLTGEYAEYNGDETETVTPEAGYSQTMTFNKDNTCTITETDEGHTESMSGTYTVKDGKLTLTVDRDSQTYNIDNIDKKEMTLSYSESHTYAADDEENYFEQAYSESFSITINMKKK